MSFVTNDEVPSSQKETIINLDEDEKEQINYDLFGKLSPVLFARELVGYDFSMFVEEEKQYLFCKDSWTAEEIKYLASEDKRLDLPLFAFLNEDIYIEDLPTRFKSDNNIWIKYLDLDTEGGFGFSMELLKNILTYCDLNVCKQLLVKEVCFGTIAEHGRIDVFMWLYNEHDNKTQEYIKNKVSITREVVTSGNLELVKWLIKNGFKFDVYAFRRAARCGHLEIMKLMREHGCPWDHGTFRSALESNNLEIADWLKINNCPLPLNVKPDTSEEVSKWMEENGLENVPRKLAIFEWMVEQGL